MFSSGQKLLWVGICLVFSLWFCAGVCFNIFCHLCSLLPSRVLCLQGCVDLWFCTQQIAVRWILLVCFSLISFVLELCEHDLLALACFCGDQEFLCFQKEELRITGTLVTVSFTSHQKNEEKASESLLCA
jgi:hypothetical protein